jgi:hypothetical protein
MGGIAGGEPELVARWPMDLLPIRSKRDRTDLESSVRRGAAIRVTAGTASQAFESADGRVVYFVRSMDAPGLWSVPASGGDETFVLAGVREAFWAVADRGVAFLISDPKLSPAGPTIRFFDFASRTTATLATLPITPAPISPGFSVARDGRSIVWAQPDSFQSDLMLIDPWPPH